MAQRGAAKNRIRAMLRTNAIVAPRGLWSLKGLAWLKELKMSELEDVQLEMLLDELGTFSARIARVESVLKKRADQEPAVDLLMTIRGVGIRTAEAVVAYIADPHRFRRNKSVGCYFGIVPCEDTSVKAQFWAHNQGRAFNRAEAGGRGDLAVDQAEPFDEGILPACLP